MANRNATQTDLDNFSTWMNGNKPAKYQMQIGDRIIDEVDGNGAIIINSGELSGGGDKKVWVDYNVVPVFSYLDCPDASGIELGSDLAFSGVNGPMVCERRNNGGNFGFQVELTDARKIILDGFMDSHPGLFSYGKPDVSSFGIQVVDKQNSEVARIVSIGVDNVIASAGLEFLNVATMGGFAGLRGQRNEVAVEVLLDVIGCAMLWGPGEGGYIGDTGDAANAPFILINNCFNFLCYARGNEGWQSQDQKNGGAGLMENFVIFAPDTKWRNPFQNNQDYGLQTDVIQGDIDIRDYILVGGAQSLNHFFAFDRSGRGTDPTGRVDMYNGKLTKARSSAFRYNGNAQYMPFHTMSEILVPSTENNYDRIKANKDFWIENFSTNGNKKIYVDCSFGPGKSQLLDPGGDFTDFEFINTTIDNVIPEPQFRNLGYPFDGLNLEVWAELGAYSGGAYIGPGLGDAIEYNAGVWTIDYNVNEQDGDIALSLCIQTHTASAASRPLDGVDRATYWTRYYIDGDGNLTTNPAGAETLYFPDLRTVEGSDDYEARRGILQETTSDSFTRHYWYYKRNGQGSRIPLVGHFGLDLPDLNKYRFLDSGDVLQMDTIARDAAGVIHSAVSSNEYTLP